MQANPHLKVLHLQTVMASSQVTVGIVLTGQMDLKGHGSSMSPTRKHLMRKRTSGVLKICRTIRVQENPPVLLQSLTFVLNRVIAIQVICWV